MNILIPHQWLLDHLETKADPKIIQEKVSLCGPSIERIYDIQNDSVYDIEVTTNRVDSMSVRGFAREVAVILTQFGIKSQLKELNLLEPKSTNALALPKINNDPKLCKRVICVVLKDVNRNPTPEWMANRLNQVSLNVHDSVIDITNYITHDLGHPCHAFDYDKLMQTGGVINIVQASKGEEFTTLDQETFTTVGGEVVFKNGKNEIIDLPSIKGTANTSIDTNTKNVLLLLESIKADKVRFASMTHAIRTTAAQLMEKEVDPNLAKEVLLKGIELYQNLCQAKVASEIYDDFPAKTQLPIINLELSTIDNYLGLKLNRQQIKHILTDLGCQVTINRNQLHVQPPSFRSDLSIAADVVEEIARIYGYHNLPSQLMETAIPTTKQEGVNFPMENKIRNFLAAVGWQEVYTYSMVSKALALQSGHTLEDHLQIQNPLTEDKVYLRLALYPSLIDVIKQNTMTQELSVFEIANIYLPQENDIPNHRLQLCLVSSKDYRQIKGDLEAMLSKLYVSNWEVKQENKTSASLIVTNLDQNIKLGQISKPNSKITVIEIWMENLMLVSKNHPTYQSLPKTTSIIEDMTFTIPMNAQVGVIIQAIKELSTLVDQVKLIDIYHQNHSFQITYLDRNNNLSVDNIEPIRKNIAQLLSQKFDAHLVGQV